MDDDAPRPSPIRLDSHSLRALAHPLRLRLVGALRLHGPATATMLARRLDTNSGQTSYHLRQLAEARRLAREADRLSARGAVSAKPCASR